ncbi:MAG: rod shape-determining protein MreC [Candidatus Eremiobacteraeota bacterium]|nr:rod shape-determining protein MreC [Candidatus Eremiobacteraeota bacterium]
MVAIVQVNAQRSRAESPIATVATSFFALAEMLTSATIGGIRTAGSAALALPQLERDNARLRAQNTALIAENARLHELAAAYASEAGVRVAVDLYHGIEARVIGFPPENESRAVTIDRGSSAGVKRDEGVVTIDGVVGRVAAVGPFSSTVVLVTDYTSRIPAVVRRGHWWGIARGNLGSVRMEYVLQDAPLKVGDVVVTGEGRSFHSGVPIGTITATQRGDATLYQTAVVTPAVDLGALDRVVVVPR